MNLVDLKYVGLLSSQLEGYTVKRTNPHLINFRCPLCGDSHRNKSKKRGFVHEVNNNALFFCHNCGANFPLGVLIKRVNASLYKEYAVEKKLDQLGGPKHNVEYDAPSLEHFQAPPIKNYLEDLQRISRLPASHKAKQYVTKRQIPSRTHHRLYYAAHFNEWVNSILPKHLPVKGDQPRLVLPLIDSNGKIFGAQGRSLGGGLRYITVMFDRNKSKLFGLEAVKLDQPFFVVEGPIDSLFLSNAIAMVGADAEVPNRENATLVFDNEPRNEQIVSRMRHALENGDKIVIWPHSVAAKDINDMVVDLGYTSDQLEQLMKQHTYRGLGGLAVLQNWKRVGA